MRKHADGKEREYDRINNEGGEGYNPHRAARQEREYEREREAELAWSKTREGRREAIYRLLGALDRDIDRAEIAALRAERDQIEADETAEFASAWPRELTIQRRAEWNARVQGGAISTARQLMDAEREQGWTISDLKKAIKINIL